MFVVVFQIRHCVLCSASLFHLRSAMVIRSDGCRVHPCIMFREGLLGCDCFLFCCQFLLQVSHVSPRVIVFLEQHSGGRQGIAHSGQRLLYYGCVM